MDPTHVNTKRVVPVTPVRWYLRAMDKGMTRTELIRMRKAAGLTQAKLAKILGCTSSRVSGVEVGRLDVNPEDIEKWANACGFDVAVQFLPHAQKDVVLQAAKRLADLPDERRRLVEEMIAELSR